MRDKLIELIEEAAIQYLDAYANAGKIADFLIANGVTIAAGNNVGNKRNIRPIDAYTLAEEIESLQITVGGKPAHWCDAKHTVLRMIAEQPDVPDTNVGKWIPVSERLPEPFVSVLVQMPDEEPCPTVHEGFLTKNGTWYAAHFEREQGEVTHWMPMPKPPKEGA